MYIDNHKLIAECSAYDFKEALERKKTKSWLKTISAFANGNGGSLYYGIADDGTVIGLTDAQSDAEFISEAIKVRIDPIPDFQLLLHTTNEGQIILEVKIESGNNCPIYQSRLFCTRWDGLEKDYAIGDAEYSGNLIMLLRNGADFIKSFTNKGWKKLPNRRLNLPDYAERATFEGLVNHLIHRDYTVIGSEVHLDIYDDRLVLTSPGGMYDGTLIQERDINTVASCRRNPVIADVFAQLDFMEKRGSGLRKICRESAILPNYKEEMKPSFHSEGTQFSTTFRNVNYEKENAPESILKGGTKGGIESGTKGGTKSNIVQLIAENPNSTILDIANALNLSKNAVVKHIDKLKDNGIIERVGPNKGGYWKVLQPNPKTNNNED